MAKNKYVINPFTGKFDTVSDRVSFSEKVAELRNCDVALQVGDLVVESETLADTVETVNDNTDIRPVIGIVADKLTTTLCRVMFIGTVTGLAGGLNKGRKVFLSTTGSFTSTPPITDYVQNLGVAKEGDEVDFNPQLQRVRRV